MRDISIKDAGQDFQTGKWMLAVSVGCECFIFRREDEVIPFLTEYLKDPHGVEDKFYKRTAKEADAPTPPWPEPVDAEMPTNREMPTTRPMQRPRVTAR
jgi:hypothetical protein